MNSQQDVIYGLMNELEDALDKGFSPIGSIAIVICVPITAFIASSLIKNTAKKIEFPTIQE